VFGDHLHEFQSLDPAVNFEMHVVEGAGHSYRT
jgi:hypothetical protein